MRITVCAFLLWLVSVCYCDAGPREVLVVSEAEAKAQASQRRVLPNDFNVQSGVGIELPESVSTAATKYVITVVGASWCGPCRAYEKELGDGGDEITIQHVDLDDPEQLRGAIAEYGPLPRDSAGDIVVPLTLFRDESGKSLYLQGNVSKSHLLERLRNNKAEKSLPSVSAAAGASGVIRGRSYIIAAIAFVRSRIGENVTVSIRFDRTGPQSFPILKSGTRWSTDAIFGRSGRFDVSAKASKLPFRSLGFTYVVNGSDLTIDADPITLVGVVDRLSSDNTASSYDSAVEPVGVDPATVLMVLSVIRSICQFLNPSVDLEVGGNLSCEATLVGDVLRIKFIDAPKLRIRVLWQRLLGVEQLTISPDNVVLDFANPPGVLFPVKPRTFIVQE